VHGYGHKIPTALTTTSHIIYGEVLLQQTLFKFEIYVDGVKQLSDEDKTFSAGKKVRRKYFSKFVFFIFWSKMFWVKKNVFFGEKKSYIGSI
jgi:hypothetical protein